MKVRIKDAKQGAKRIEYAGRWNLGTFGPAGPAVSLVTGEVLTPSERHPYAVKGKKRKGVKGAAWTQKLTTRNRRKNLHVALARQRMMGK